MVGLIRAAESGEFIRIFTPVEIAGIHNGSAYGCGMSVHVLGRGMGDNVGSEIEWIAVNGCGKGIVHNERYLMVMGKLGKLFNIKHYQRRLCNGFRQYALSVLLKSFRDFLSRPVRVNHSTGNTHFFHGNRQQVKSASVYGRRKNHMVPCLTDIEYRIIVGRLTGACQHCGNAAL